MKNKPSVLIVDDDRTHRTMLRALIGGWGYDAFEADDGSTAMDQVQERPFDLVLMDVRMLKVSGLEALERIKAFNPAIPVTIMTAYSSVETAIEALKKGAYDYLTKPLDFDKLRLTLERAMEHIRLKEENRILKENLGKHFDMQNIIGRSPAMITLLETVAHVAPSEATVMITGESGTGKELIAGVIHFNSPRKGAFTGADRRKEGRFYQAHGGTLFLDEVSEMPLTMQVKLLRVLQERELTRVGGEKVITVDVRIISATNKNLPELKAQGGFREDLYYRLNVVSLDIPPLRERIEDIPLLARHFLEMFAKKNRKEIKGFTPVAMDRLIRYDWPGNVRELMNAVERAVVLARTDYLDDTDFTIMQNLSGQSDEPLPVFVEKDNHISLEQVEKVAILHTLKSVAGNKSEAARRLGITRKTLHKKLKKYGVMP
jgi:two-component system response regulator HydG